ncbi:hypothetical protein MBEHAL_1722 [Halarchaeum acidiphilum MH1-52-1]|uniref:Small CPxCG-related zinc finger protein n=1 Tax=Halarchaeum acidiphilum MH1-52-1 TaxID=1261545 RepID=U2YW09_9EURY|nr:hypothetical protein [Halarchaeum acidiphilum]GAD52962.1 hypothetical protein MBEHAL_1722 [Halarchaeum acidiphilum MH1-52-1]
MPTRDRDRIGSAVQFDECAHCGRELESGTWQPVRTVEGDDGVLSFHAFCDDECRDAYDPAAD